MLQTLQNGKCSFNFHHPTHPYKQPYNPQQQYPPLLQTIQLPNSPPYLFEKPSLQSPPTLPSTTLYSFFTSIFSHATTFLINHSHLSLLAWSMNKMNSPYHQWFLTAEAQKVGVLQVVASDEDNCDQNTKMSTQPFPIPSIYYYFCDLPISPQELTCPRETSCVTKTIFILSLTFSFTIHGPFVSYV